MSNSLARSRQESAWRSSVPVFPICSEGAVGKTDASSAFVSESPDAKSVTSWPASTRPSASSDTTHSIPP